MRINNIPYLLKEGIRGLFAHGLQSASAWAVTVFSLLITGAFVCLAFNINVMIDDLNKTNEVVVYVQDTLTDAEAKSIGTQISNIPNVQNRTFVTREQALKEFIEKNGDKDAFAGVEASDLRHRYVVTLEDNHMIHETVKQLEAIQGVDKVSAAFELAEGFSTIKDIVVAASLFIAAVLLFVTFIIIFNTVRLATHERKEEIAIMKMVGATNGFIRCPFVVEGMTLGLTGAMAALGAEWVLYDAAVKKLQEMDTLKMLHFVPFKELLVMLAAIFAAAGLFVGIVGGWVSIRKFLKV
ncbi:MAG: ABC transporter permease [Ruminococcaceae bacterium]|nr:ABC transporter permease [Oscillospiraceae bacterium]